ncbi:MAG: type II secretion system protein GspD [Gammaproteobacteria bacterium RIFCSPHIGHO2_12_FULL_37_14]|nr:MAG: type II secretion system protein GspD [Gammaproteobacteria bacterium RIFCSPHIGHO2_12_FULL_37_14]
MGIFFFLNSYGAIASSSSLLTPTNNTSIPQISTTSPRLWNLQDADILSVINEVSQETGRNFVVDPRVNGKISLVSSKPLRKEEVYQVFLSVLGLLGYSAIPNGNVIKIVPNMESGEQATAVASKQSPGKGDEVVVRVIALENISATQLMPVIRPMLPQWSNVATYSPGNVLILLGRAANLERIIKVIQDVDKAANNGIQMIALHQAQASQVAMVLNNLQAAARSAGEIPSISIAVDERSNSILLGGPKLQRLRMSMLISQLDAPSSTPSGNTEVIYLRYLEAKTFAPLLGKIAQNILGKDTGSHYNPATYPGSGVGATSGTKDTNTNFTNIQAEPNSNAVIITAPPTLMQALKSVIAKVDIRPAQVLVEAIIAEIDESNLKSLGIQWGSVTPSGNLQPSVVTDFPSLGAGVVGIMPSVQIRSVLSVLQNQNGVDILSTPQIVVLDNQKATIEIGQMVPTQTGAYASSNGVSTVTPFVTNDYKNVTLKLDVTPQINLGNSVLLKLKLKNDTLQNPHNPGPTPLINTSSINNAVIINSEDVLVLGGLMSNSNNENINKVPILGDLPIVGAAFQQKASRQQKRTLMVFIKPVIFQNTDNALVITENKYNAIRMKQANFRDELQNIGREPVKTLLPPWKNSKDLPKPFENS